MRIRMNSSLLLYINKAKSQGKKLLAILLDPDKVHLKDVPTILKKIENSVNFIFVGGSTVSFGDTEKLVIQLKEMTSIPVILFPGDYSQITDKADAILFLSLLSGDNPEYLIKQQLKSVLALQQSNLEIIPTGYILIDGGKKTAVQQVSNTTPIGNTNISLATQTAIAGMYLGKQLIYLEAGSGANTPVNIEIIASVNAAITIPLIVGGGIRTKKQLEDAYRAGADIVVIGTAFEENYLFFDTL